MKKITGIVVFVVAGILIAGGVYAQFAKPEDAIKYRKAAMFMIAQHFKRMGAAVQGNAPYEKQAFAENAEVVKMLSTLPWEAALVPGTDMGDTTLKAEAFSKKDDFMKTALAFEEATSKLAETSGGDDFDAIKAQFGVVAKSCKDCHTPFRK